MRMCIHICVREQRDVNEFPCNLQELFISNENYINNQFSFVFCMNKLDDNVIHEYTI